MYPDCWIKPIGNSSRITDPNTAMLARDVKELIRHSYKLERVTPFDMFPQTQHCEAIAELTRL